jgi:hypothetical protein
LIRSGKTIKPGQPGTKKWIDQFGEKLVCVRYKYDFQRKRKLKTVELIVEEETWNLDKDRIPANKLVGVKVEFGEIQTGRLVRSAGGRWNRKKKLWELSYQQVIALGLDDRIVME